MNEIERRIARREADAQERAEGRAEAPEPRQERIVIFDGRKGFRKYESSEEVVLGRQFGQPFSVEAYGQDTLTGSESDWLVKREDGSFEVVSDAEFTRRYGE